VSLEHLTFSAEHAAREWHRSFEYHLDIVPPLMDAIVTATLPSIPVSRGGSRFDRVQITGDNAHRDVSDSLVSTAPATQEARAFWWMVVDYAAAVADWIKPEKPAPDLDEKPNADPLLARGIALTTVGWLIDHAEQIRQVVELEPTMDDLFSEIRHLRGKYGVSPRPRRPLGRCPSCHERQVSIQWVTNPNGSLKPLRVGKCRSCSSEHEIHDEPEPHTGTVVLSSVCAETQHRDCESVHCGCPCHTITRKP
jgi:hypothetical protein